MTQVTDAGREAVGVTKAEALTFLEEATRNWPEAVYVHDDVEDVRVALRSFLARHREASTAALMGEVEKVFQGREHIDREALDRWRDSAKQGRGHDMCNANNNTLGRLIATIDTLCAALSTTDTIGVGEAEKVGEMAAFGASHDAISLFPDRQDLRAAYCQGAADAAKANYTPQLVSGDAVSREAEWTVDEVRQSIRHVIDAPGWSHNTLARTVGISPAKLSEFLSGKRGAERGIVEPLGFRWKLVQDAEASFTLPPTGDAVREAVEDIGLRVAERIRQELTSDRQWSLDGMEPAKREEFEAEIASTCVAVCEQELSGCIADGKAMREALEVISRGRPDAIGVARAALAALNHGGTQ